jgi:hypothetical protein
MGLWIVRIRGTLNVGKGLYKKEDFRCFAGKFAQMLNNPQNQLFMLLKKSKKNIFNEKRAT